MTRTAEPKPERKDMKSDEQKQNDSQQEFFDELTRKAKAALERYKKKEREDYFKELDKQFPSFGKH